MAYVARLGALWETARPRGIPLSDLPVGAILRGTFNNAATDFILVQQGSPSSLYNGFDGTTTLLFKDIVESRQWHSSNVNDYANSTIQSYLNNAFLALFDEKIRAQIKQVKIPYRPGSGTSMIVNSGANGLSAFVWPLSANEVNWTSQFAPADGATFSYFTGTAATDAKRIAYLNSTATNWWLRTPHTSAATYAWCVRDVGDCSYTFCTAPQGIRPAFVLPNTMLVEGTPNPDGSYNLTV